MLKTNTKKMPAFVGPLIAVVILSVILAVSTESF